MWIEKKICKKIGMSLTEIMVMLAILGVVMVPIMNILLSSVKIHKISKSFYRTINFASSYMEAIRSLDKKKFKFFTRTKAVSAPKPFDTKSLHINFDKSRISPFIKIEKCKKERDFEVFKIIIEVEETEKTAQKKYALCSMILREK
ncbi:hypothetical protein ACFL35_13265 [Candidatus Riflebacteria bacterium]